MSELDRFTARRMKELEGQIIAVYKQAQKEIAEKLVSFTDAHKAKDAIMRAKRDAGEITKAYYRKWLRGQVFTGKNWRAKQKQIAAILVQADRDAAKLINKETRVVFTEGSNFAAYDIEKNLGGAVNLTLYNNTAVAQLIKDEPELLPRRVLDDGTDVAWQTKKVANAVTQAIIQGESIPEISKRIARETGIEAGKASTRYARTAMTGAANAGRQQRMEEESEELEELGIEMRKRWDALLDDRTRDAHADLDGVTIPVDESFHNSIGYIKFPGDPSADAANVYNCRCSLSYVYPQFKTTRNRKYYVLEEQEDGKKKKVAYDAGDMTYWEWKRMKEGKK